MDALLDAIEILQGVELIASDLEREILPARVANYQPSDLDALLASGEVVWVGSEPLGDRDGRIALYLVESLGRLIPPDSFAKLPEGYRIARCRILDFLQQQGASFQATIHQAAGGGFPNETTDALWELVWAGLITNDTFHPVRALLHRARTTRSSAAPSTTICRRDRRDFCSACARAAAAISAGQGRWSLVQQRIVAPATPTEWSAAIAQQMLVRNGIVMRETACGRECARRICGGLSGAEDDGGERLGAARNVRGGHGRGAVRDACGGGYAAQFAAAWRSGRKRSTWRRPIRRIRTAACCRGSRTAPDHSMARAAGASVILVNGRLAAFFRRRNPAIRVFLPEDEPERSQVARELAQKLADVGDPPAGEAERAADRNDQRRAGGASISWRAFWKRAASC